jgi:hypothetical protein
MISSVSHDCFSLISVSAPALSSMPSARYSWQSSNSTILSVDAAMGVGTGLVLGHARVLVKDGQLDVSFLYLGFLFHLSFFSFLSFRSKEKKATCLLFSLHPFICS